MQRPRWLTATAAIGAIAMAATLAGTTGAVAQAGGTGRHVLLISVDGLHASDLARWVDEHPSSSLAALSGAGTTYANASASEPSDSFPGLLAPLTGGTPRSNGVYYAAGYALNVDGSQSRLKLPEPELQITDSVANTEAYDQLKVDAVLNEIKGLSSLGTRHAAVPAVFGMNFQSVSVGQKLVDPELSCARSNNASGCDPHYVPGGYEPGSLDFTPQLADALTYVDGALGKMALTLRSEGLWASTKVIVT